MTELRVALLSSCTIEVLERPFSAALRVRGFAPSFWTGGFGQYAQDILNVASQLYAHAPDVVVLYLDGEDLFQEILTNPFAASIESRRAHGAHLAAQLRFLIETICTQMPRTTVIVNTIAVPPLNALSGLEYNSEFGIQDAVAIYNAGVAELAATHASVVVVDVASLIAWHGYSHWRDGRMWYLARLRWSRIALHALASAYTAAIRARLGRAAKAIVLDLDNTLWGGVIGEDGIEGIRLGEEGIGRAFVEFQDELLNLYRKGVILAICSKNNPDDALQAIREHPSMRLREEHFAAVRINWEDKASNLRAIVEELNIGADALVFIDDNPVERTWVRQSAPEVIVPEWPTDPVEYKTALLELTANHFPKLGITAEDRKRGEQYKAQAARRMLATSQTSVEDFYRALEMRVRVGRANAFTIPRIAQLTQKTNQFNLTTRRYTEADIRAAAEDPTVAVFWLDLDDRFGRSGIVGVLILRQATEAEWTIDTFLLSCRVMGRTVENAFLAIAAQESGAAKLLGEYRSTPKNAPVRDLYQRLGFERVRDTADGAVWSMDLLTTPIRVPEWFEVTIETDSVLAAPQ